MQVSSSQSFNGIVMSDADSLTQRQLLKGAVLMGNVGEVVELFAEGMFPLNVHDQDPDDIETPETALDVACRADRSKDADQKNSLAIVSLLLQHKADPNFHFTGAREKVVGGIKADKISEYSPAVFSLMLKSGLDLKLVKENSLKSNGIREKIILREALLETTEFPDVLVNLVEEYAFAPQPAAAPLQKRCSYLTHR